MDWWSLLISITALALSAATAWLTLVHRGRLKMTRPSVIFFGFDSTPNHRNPKVFFRALLYSTSARGQLVEGVHVKLSRGETSQNFTIWVYGDKANLERGSGLFIGREGLSKNHHFLLAPDQKSFSFQPGEYRMRVVADIVGRQAPLLLADEKLSVSQADAEALQSADYGLYFDWGPDSKRYYPKLDHRREEFDWKPIVDRLLDSTS